MLQGIEDEFEPGEAYPGFICYIFEHMPPAHPAVVVAVPFYGEEYIVEIIHLYNAIHFTFRNGCPNVFGVGFP